MKSLLILISFLTFLNLSSNSSEFEKAKDTIELRQSVMQGIWVRVKRLAPFIEVNNNLEYNEQLARQDAEDIKLLLEKSFNLWPRSTNLSTKNLTNATPAVWAIEDYFNKLYNKALVSAKKS